MKPTQAVHVQRLYRVMTFVSDVPYAFGLIREAVLEINLCGVVCPASLDISFCNMSLVLRSACRPVSISTCPAPLLVVP